MGEVTSYSKAAIDALLGGGGGGGGGGGTIDDLELAAALALKADVTALTAAVSSLTAQINLRIAQTEKMAANGVAALGADAKILDSQLPLLSATLLKVQLSNVALGIIPAYSSMVWTEVTNVARRGLMTKVIVSPSLAAGPETMFDLEIRSAPAGGGELFLQATGVPNQSYEHTVPVYLEGDDVTRSIWVGVRNNSQWSATYTLTALRVERFA